ncbi:hypothetical protein [Tissierella creatinophila]|uniref:Uncharacterized protein n=1 Tax=Tissierella creatinophila DSM 6911 TaxID=1123403 RepID=A0A1U7M521_TISCR|nr:hypothetical protein [Tissierella creatinophila]OLS02407.1 hypothetical protein TICRE_15960 [Tissierella creatinophila DSM 6911]
MKNTLGDLNNHLFAQLERLSDEDIKGEELKEEIERAKAVTSISSSIIQNANLVFQSKKFMNDLWDADTDLPKMLEG